MSRATAEVLRVDPTACTAHGLCAVLLAEWIRLDEWGYPMIGPGALPGGLVEHARRAAYECPARALRLTRSLA